jgi:hypothetical protein
VTPKAHSPKACHAVTYYRVSTAEQGHSGLGLEAQQAGVWAFVAAQGWIYARDGALVVATVYCLNLIRPHFIAIDPIPAHL